MEFSYPKPTQKVVDKKDGIYVDGFRLEYVIEDSVKKEELSPGQVIVSLSFIASSYEKEDQEN